jgi:preprotein translocase subunit SecG
MILTLLSVFYVLVAIAMIALILMQRGAGAAAGSGFGGGASATVFGARGSANFLSKSTAILAVAFFAISISMAMIVTRSAKVAPAEDLGVMGAVPSASEAAPSELPVAVPAPGSEVSELPTRAQQREADEAQPDPDPASE